MYRQQIAKKKPISSRVPAINKPTIPTPSYGSLWGTIQRAKASPDNLREDEWQQLDSAMGTRQTNEISAGNQTSWMHEFHGISAQIGSESGVDTPVQRMSKDHAKKRENKTGLPDQLKSGIENLSGYSMENVRVHYNSQKPAELQAHAYAQGTEIHIAPGQEQHLPHEAWHVVQQMQGRVKPTKRARGKSLNEEVPMEREAERMGKKADARAYREGTNTTCLDAPHRLGARNEQVRSSEVEGERTEHMRVGHTREIEVLVPTLLPETKESVVGDRLATRFRSDREQSTYQKKAREKPLREKKNGREPREGNPPPNAFLQVPTKKETHTNGTGGDGLMKPVHQCMKKTKKPKQNKPGSFRGLSYSHDFKINHISSKSELSSLGAKIDAARKGFRRADLKKADKDGGTYNNTVITRYQLYNKLDEKEIENTEANHHYEHDRRVLVPDMTFLQTECYGDDWCDVRKGTATIEFRGNKDKYNPSKIYITKLAILHKPIYDKSTQTEPMCMLRSGGTITPEQLSKPQTDTLATNSSMFPFPSQKPKSKGDPFPTLQSRKDYE